ncbi:hypothetical protein ACWC3X_28370 [Streptomyces populi]|jgi:hypothetical protein
MIFAATVIPPGKQTIGRPAILGRLELMKRLAVIVTLVMASAFAMQAGAGEFDGRTTVAAASTRDVGWD